MIKRTEDEIMASWKGDIVKPLVSVCTITYNHEKYIAEALDSFLIQETDFPFEIVVDDDCSTDNNAKIIRQYADRFPNIIKANLREKNVGAMTNSIENMKRAKGKYIALCEGDDYWTDALKLQIQIYLMRANPECHLSFHPSVEVIDDELSRKVWGNHDDENKIFTDIEMIRGIGNVFCPTASMVFCRKVMDPIPNFFDSAPVGDNFIQFLGSLDGGALFIARKMSIYRRGNSGSWSTTMNKKSVESTMALIESRKTHTFRYIKSLDDMGSFIDQKYREEIDKKISESLFSLSLLCLGNNMNKDFSKIIIQSYERYKFLSLLHKSLYYFRFNTYLAKQIIKFKNYSFIRKFYSNIKITK